MAVQSADTTIALVAPQWRNEFLRFVETGDASTAFIDYLDDDESCQQAVDAVIDQQADSLQDVVRSMRTGNVRQRLAFSNLPSPQFEIVGVVADYLEQGRKLDFAEMAQRLDLPYTSFYENLGRAMRQVQDVAKTGRTA